MSDAKPLQHAISPDWWWAGLFAVAVWACAGIVLYSLHPATVVVALVGLANRIATLRVLRVSWNEEGISVCRRRALSTSVRLLRWEEVVGVGVEHHSRSQYLVLELAPEAVRDGWGTVELESTDSFVLCPWKQGAARRALASAISTYREDHEPAPQPLPRNSPRSGFLRGSRSQGGD